MEDGMITRLADLLVGVGANVQPHQILCVNAKVGQEDLARAIAARAYEAGARGVEVVYDDSHVKRARIEHGSDEAIGFAPSWQVERVRNMGDQKVAVIALEGPTSPDILAGLDPSRVANDQLPTRREWLKVVNDRSVNWTIGPYPNPAWAALVYPDEEPEQALRHLWEAVAHMCRLDEDDPVEAWRQRMATLHGVSERLTERRFSALHYEGPGTDFTLGLLPGSKWLSARFTTAEGLEHWPNLPTEEVFTAPDPARANGVVRSTKPLELDGTIIRDLEVRFEGGKAVEINASTGAEVLRGRTALDDGGMRLGEVALVDRDGRIGPLDTTFWTTLIDENAASHLALGNAYAFSVDDSERDNINKSTIHIDFMIGSNDIAVTGITTSGDRVPVLRDGAWQV
jgi:aminopeptidase